MNRYIFLIELCMYFMDIIEIINKDQTPYIKVNDVWKLFYYRWGLGYPSNYRWVSKGENPDFPFFIYWKWTRIEN